MLLVIRNLVKEEWAVKMRIYSREIILFFMNKDGSQLGDNASSQRLVMKTRTAEAMLVTQNFECNTKVLSEKGNCVSYAPHRFEGFQ